MESYLKITGIVSDVSGSVRLQECTEVGVGLGEGTLRERVVRFAEVYRRFPFTLWNGVMDVYTTRKSDLIR